MFDFLIKAIEDLGEWTGWAVGSIWDTVVGWFKGIWMVVLSFFAVLYALFEGIIEFINAVGTQIASISFPSISFNGGAIGGYANIANTFFPLSEACAFLVAYFGLLVALNIYRLIKSWIPTLS